MPEVQKSVLEHAAPKADQNQGLDGQLTDGSLPESNYIVKEVTGGVFRKILRTHVTGLPISEEEFLQRYARFLNPSTAQIS